jgi:hypothetical protein
VVVRVIISAIRRFSPGERSRGVCRSVRIGAIPQQGLMIPGSVIPWSDTAARVDDPGQCDTSGY